MARYVASLLLSLSLIAGTAAQGGDVLDVYPIRVNHKMGYVKFYPYDSATIIIDTVIPPQYDYIADINLPYHAIASDGASSPYRIFELDEKVGLLGPSLNRVVPNNYNRIRVVTDSFLAVELDSLFLLADTRGRVHLDSTPYQDICLAEQLPGEGQAYFFVKNEKGWGLRRLNGPLLVGHQYGDIRQAGTPGFYKVKKSAIGSQWELIDSVGKKVLQNTYDDILVLDTNLIALQKGVHWQLIHRRKGPKGVFIGGFVRLEEPYSFFERIEKVNSRLAVMAPVAKEVVVELWDIRTQKRLVKNDAKKRPSSHTEQPKNRDKKYLPWYFPIEGEELFAICNKDFNRVGQVDYLIDSAGHVISGPYAFIEPSGQPHIFRVGKLGRWGLLAPQIDSLPIADCDYHGLTPFRENVAVTRIGGSFGAIVITEKGLDSLPCIYDNLARRPGSKLKARMGGRQIVDYSLDSLGKLALDTVYSGLYIAEDAEKPFQEAEPVEVRASRGYTPKTYDWGKLYVTEKPNSLFLNKMDPNDMGPGGDMRPLWTRRLRFFEKPASIREIVEDSIIVFTHRGRPFDSDFTRRLFAREVAGKAFYNLGKGTDITDFPILGLRDFDYNYSYSAFIDESGKMGLVNAFGEQLARRGQPARFTYIGPFRAGLARACIGGELVLFKKGLAHEEPSKFRLGYQWEFSGEFNVNLLEPSSPSVRDGEVYVMPGPDNPCRWVFIDTTGAIVLEPEASHVKDFQETDSARFALILQRSQGGLDLYGRPDADFGLVNEQGEVLIEPAFDDIKVFPEYFGVAKRGTPVFFFNSKGHELFINRTRLRPFSEGLAHFYDQEKRWGYIDSTGRVVIPPRFLEARPFSEGLAAVADTSGYCSFINKKGEVVFRTNLPNGGWQFLGNFKGGRCWFKGEGNKWGCYGRSGKVAIPPAFFFENGDLNFQKPYARDSILQTLFSLPMDFSHGVAAVKASALGGAIEPAVIDSMGQRISLTEKYGDISPFDAHGLAVVANPENKRQGLLNARGEVLLAPKYRKVGPFINGYARVQAENRRWGLVDKEGEVVVPFQYTEIDTVSEGLAAVRPTAKQSWAFIDTTNHLCIKGPFEQTQPFEKGYSLVTVSNQKQIIDQEGQLVFIKNDTVLFYSEGIFGMKEALPPGTAENTRKRKEEPPSKYYYADASGNNLFGRYFDHISPFEAGIAAVQPAASSKTDQNRFGAINKRGVMVVPPKYGFVKRQPDGNIGTNPQRFYGLIHKNGQQLMEADYDRIERFGEHDLYRVERGEKIGYLMKRGEQMVWAWPLQN